MIRDPLLRIVFGGLRLRTRIHKRGLMISQLVQTEPASARREFKNGVKTGSNFANGLWMSSEHKKWA
jgi:hypothetical protein